MTCLEGGNGLRLAKRILGMASDDQNGSGQECFSGTSRAVGWMEYGATVVFDF